jgi:hypothetical protein
MGNAATWPFPVLHRVVKGATPERVVLDGAAGLLDDFLAAAMELVAFGAEAITTNCGFLSVFQAELAAHVRVPVATSALIQVPWVQALLPPGQRVGIITVSAGSLTPRHLAAAGVAADTPFVGAEGGREFFRVLIRGEKQDMDVALAAADILDAGRTLVSRHPDVGAIVLECTNMPPYAFALREALGLPVYDIYSLITWLHAGLRPREFGPPADRHAHLSRIWSLEPMSLTRKRVLVTGGAGFLRVASLRAPAEGRPRCAVRRQLLHGSQRQHRTPAGRSAFRGDAARHHLPALRRGRRSYNLACPASPVHYQYVLCRPPRPA